MPRIAALRKPLPQQELHLTPSPLPTPVAPPFAPTDEQIEIGRRWVAGENLVVNAFAGSGKTSLLKYLTFLKPQVGKLWCFNKHNADEAREKFIPTTQCETTHSCALRAVREAGVLRPQQMSGLNTRWPTFQVIKEFGVTATCGVTNQHVAFAAIQSLNRFMHSADEALTIQHCYDSLRPQNWFKSRLIEDHCARYPNESLEDLEAWQDRELPKLTQAIWMGYRQRLLSLATDLWAAIWDEQHPYPMQHDAYLKAWQLMKPVIPGIRFLMVDEYQDTNPCVEDIVLQQTCQVVVVGDHCQGLYDWRGAANAMKRAKGGLCYMTKSHRFGDVVARIATQILHSHYLDIPAVRGTERVRSEVGLIDARQPYAHISRTNAGVFENSVEAVSRGRSIHVVGSIRDAIERAKSVWGLYDEDYPLVKHPEIKPYEDWETLTQEAETDAELNRYVKLVKNYDRELPRICRTLEQAGETKTMEDADVVLSTVHKSKGFEFEQVLMGDDFFRVKVEEDENGIRCVTGPEQEFNALYVAATRAIHRLQLNKITTLICEDNG
jgi:hypothetical protein